MALIDAPGLVAGTVALGALHGAEPGHGWPIAATYALDRTNRWLSGALAGLVIGTGHLISSLAVVGVFFLLKSQIPITGLTEPLRVAGVSVGSPIGVVAGVLLIGLGVREYRGEGHSHGHGAGDDHSHAHDDHSHDHDDHSHAHDDHSHDHDDHSHDHDDHSHDHDDHDHSHDHDDHDHSHDHDDHDHSHDHGDLATAADEGLWSVAVSAFVLGFAHEEEFEIIAICAGSSLCLELMTIYALTVVAVITLATLVLVAGYEAFRDRVERLSRHFSTLSAVVLWVLGVGFALGVV
jgi:ABC-type nickel/cobalt efflux system permease component RcnA